MNETPASSDQNELSDDDLAVLRAFEMVEELASVDPTIAASAHSTNPLPPTSDDMLVLFVTEADGEIAAMRQALHEWEQNAPTDPANSASLQNVQRSAHKLKGTAGSVGYEHISTITRYIELLVGQVKSGIITHLTGVIALAHAIQALEATLYSVASEGREDSTPQTKLEQIYQALNVELPTKDVVGYLSSLSFPRKVGRERSAALHAKQDSRIIEPAGWDGADSSRQSLHVDARHLEQLMLHIEQLAEQRTSVEQAQKQVESAQQELYTAQQCLQQLERHLSTLPSVRREPIYRARASNSAGYDEPPTSSLIARILNESMRRVGHVYRRKNRLRPQLVRLQEAQEMRQWDVLEIDLGSADELLVVSLSEAIADVTTASTRLRTALEQLGHILQKHMAQMALVRSDARQLPHTHDAVRGLLIRVGSQCVIVPFEHVQRIEYEKHAQYDPLFVLNELLGFPAEQVITETTRPVLILQKNDMAVQVDEVVGEIEVVIKPLAPHLQRPGIAGTAIGEGKVLLVLNLSELVMLCLPEPFASLKGKLREGSVSMGTEMLPLRKLRASAHCAQGDRTILIADDSVYIRQSVLHILNHAGYEVLEARDGIEALEQLLTHRIDALLLDIEMPRLNGYDLLNIIRVNPLFARLKVVMLTSRSSEKHQGHAYALGAHGYLTKPCPQDTLLTTIESLLGRRQADAPTNSVG